MSYAALEILAVTFLLNLLQVTIGYFLINRKKVEEAKDRLQEIREEMLKAQKEGKVIESEKLVNEMLNLNNEIIKETMKVSLVTIFVIAIVFPMLKTRYANTMIQLPFPLPVVGNSLSWFWWYLITFMMVSTLTRKILNIKYI